MYDKSVRRRRITVALLVASSLLLLTVYFGESPGGGLHGVQRGVLQVVSPIQEGASRALKPVRDLVGWFGDTFKAKGQNGKLRKENAQLRQQAVAGVAAVRENQRLQGLLSLDQAGLAPARPVTARVIGSSPTVLKSTIEINKGTSDGAVVGQPVVTGDGLIGQVTTASSGTAIVTLITDSAMSVGGRVNEGAGVEGVVATSSGGPGDLRLKFTSRRDRVDVGWTVVTSGTVSTPATDGGGDFISPYPPNIPIGVITQVDDPETDDQQIHVRPFADLHRIEFVQVLTRAINGNRP